VDTEGVFGQEYLQKRLLAEFPLARHMEILVMAADALSVVLQAPLPPNANDKGTAFGGSLFSVAVLTGWAWVSLYLSNAGLAAEAVIQESTMRYLTPVVGTLRATLVPPSNAQIEKFTKMLRRAGRGRIALTVQIHHGDVLATVFDGVYAAAIR